LPAEHVRYAGRNIQTRKEPRVFGPGAANEAKKRSSGVLGMHDTGSWMSLVEVLKDVQTVASGNRSVAADRGGRWFEQRRFDENRSAPSQAEVNKTRLAFVEQGLFPGGRGRRVKGRRACAPLTRRTRSPSWPEGSGTGTEWAVQGAFGEFMAATPNQPKPPARTLPSGERLGNGG